MPNYSVRVPEDNYPVIKLFDRLKGEKVLSPRIVYLAECWLANNPDPREAEIQFLEEQIKAIRDKQEEEGYKDVPALAGLKHEINERIKEGMSERVIIGFLTGPSNKKLLRKYAMSPKELYEICINEANHDQQSKK